MFGTGSTSLKWFKRLGVYKNSTDSCSYDPSTKRGRSYNWTFCAPVNGVVVFNDYNWSPTTSHHQTAVRSILRERGIKYVSGDFGDSDVRNLGPSVSRELFKQLCELEIKIETSRKPESWTNKWNMRRAAEMRADLETLEAINSKFRVGIKARKSIRAEVEESALNDLSDKCSKSCFKVWELKRAETNLNSIEL